MTIHPHRTERNAKDIFMSESIEDLVNIRACRKCLRGRRQWEDNSNYWRRPRWHSPTWEEWGNQSSCAPTDQCFLMTASDGDRTKTIANEWLVTFQDRYHDTTLAYSTNDVREHELNEEIQDCLYPHDRMKLDSEYYEINTCCTIETTQEDTT